MPGWKTVLYATVIVAAALWVYWPALGGDWLWTDDVLIAGNSDLHSFSGLWKIWFTPPETDYWPLTWTLLWVEWHLWGNLTLGYHLCTLALHVISGFLIWNLLSKLGLRWGWLAALLFVVHPLNVDSVAWNSEVKNTVSLPLLLLSIGAFIDAEEKPASGAYVRSICFYLASMLAKTSVVMSPFILLAYCFWKHRRITMEDCKKVLPFLAIALVLGVVTLYFQQAHMAESVPGEPIATPPGLVTRFLIAGTAIYFYIGKFLFPAGLVPLYPPWPYELLTPYPFVCWPLLVLLFLLLPFIRTDIGRHLLFGLGFFVINLFPVLGILPMVYMNVSWVGNHLVYLPMIGLLGLLVAGFEVLNRFFEKPGQITLKVVIGIACVILAADSHAYARLFRSKEAIYTYTAQHNPYNYDVHNNLGICLAQDGKIQEAQAQFEMALRLNSDFADAHENLGAIDCLEGHLSEAVNQLEEAIRLNPHSATAHNSLGLAFAANPNQTKDAISEYHAAMELDRNYAEPHENLGLLLSRTPEGLKEAIGEYREALRIEPNFAVARCNLDKAILRLDPNNAVAHNNLGTAYLQMRGKLPDAIAEYREAIRIAPDFAGAQFDLANALMREPGGLQEAVAHLKIALQLDPSLQPAKKMRDQLQALYPGL